MVKKIFGYIFVLFTYMTKQILFFNYRNIFRINGSVVNLNLIVKNENIVKAFESLQSLRNCQNKYRKTN